MEPENSAKFVTIKQRKNGNVFLVINTHHGLDALVKGLVSFFGTLDQVTKHKAGVTAVAGIGIGLGFSLIVFSQPTTIQADIPMIQSNVTYRVEARELRLPSHKVATPIIWNDRSAGLGESGTVLIEVKGNHPVSSDVKKLQLGESVDVIGSNNGIYSYTVVETREVATEELNSVLQHTRETVVIYTPVDFLNTKSFVVIARPQLN